MDAAQIILGRLEVHRALIQIALTAILKKLPDGDRGEIIKALYAYDAFVVTGGTEDESQAVSRACHEYLHQIADQLVASAGGA